MGRWGDGRGDPPYIPLFRCHGFLSVYIDWRRHMGEASGWRHLGGSIWDKASGGGIWVEASGRRHLDETSGWRHLKGGIWEEAAGGRHLGGGIWEEASGGRHLGGFWEALWFYLGSCVRGQVSRCPAPPLSQPLTLSIPSSPSLPYSCYPPYAKPILIPAPP